MGLESWRARLLACYRARSPALRLYWTLLGGPSSWKQTWTRKNSIKHHGVVEERDGGTDPRKERTLVLFVYLVPLVVLDLGSSMHTSDASLTAFKHRSCTFLTHGQGMKWITRGQTGSRGTLHRQKCCTEITSDPSAWSGQWSRLLLHSHMTIRHCLRYNTFKHHLSKTRGKKLLFACFEPRRRQIFWSILGIFSRTACEESSIVGKTPIKVCHCLPLITKSGNASSSSWVIPARPLLSPPSESCILKEGTFFQKHAVGR